MQPFAIALCKANELVKEDTSTFKRRKGNCNNERSPVGSREEGCFFKTVTFKVVHTCTILTNWMLAIKETKKLWMYK